MKGTEKIIAHIEADAKAQADAVLEDAKKQCAEIIADYKNKADASYENKMAVGKRSQDELVDSRDRIAHMESKKEILALKQEMVAKSFALAAKKIASLPDEKYAEFLVDLTAKSSSSKDEQVVFNASDKEKFGKAVIDAVNEKIGGSLTLSDESGDFSGGVILKRGAVEVNNTLDLLIDLKKSEMSAELAKLLFE